MVATERDEPQAVIGSYLHQIAYPENYARHQKTKKLTQAYRHEATDVLSLQQRGEYLYVANGKGGLRVFDIANVDNKGFAERMITAPVSPLGQRFYVKTKNAMWVASPTTLAVDPARQRMPENEEQAIHLLYAYLYVADSEEGLILVNAATLLDGDPRNNFLKRAATFNPDGILNGARFVVTAGNYAYVSCDRGVVIVDIDDAKNLKVVSVIPLKGAGHTAIQFRYAFICDAEGLKVADITEPEESGGQGGGSHRGSQRRVRRPDARLRGGREAGPGDDRRGASRAARRSRVLLRRGSDQRRPRRKSRHDQCQPVCLYCRRQQRAADSAIDLARHVAGIVRIQPRRTARVDCDLPDSRPRARTLERIGSRSRRGRERESARRFRTPRRAAVQPAGNAAAVSSRWQAVHRNQRCAVAGEGKWPMKILLAILACGAALAQPVIHTQIRNGVVRAEAWHAASGQPVTDEDRAAPGETILVRASSLPFAVQGWSLWNPLGFAPGVDVSVNGHKAAGVSIGGQLIVCVLPADASGSFVELALIAGGRRSNVATIPVRALGRSHALEHGRCRRHRYPRGCCH